MLYTIHDNPSSLNHYEKLDTHYPKMVWEKLDQALLKEKRSVSRRRELFRSYEHLWAKNARYAAMYAYAFNKPFPAGEPAIAKDAGQSFMYAKTVLREPFPLGEPAIARNKRVMKMYLSRFPERAKIIEDLRPKKV